jgi:hypothetical protein
MIRLTHHNSGCVHLPVLFRKDIYLFYINRWQHKLKTRIITEPQIDIFFEALLKAGLALHDYPEKLIHHVHIKVAGGIVSPKYQDKYHPLSCYLEFVGFNKFVTLSRGLANCSPIHASIGNGTCNLDDTIWLNKTPLDRSRLSDNLLPLYINNPILGDYAKDRIAGRI